MSQPCKANLHNFLTASVAKLIRRDIIPGTIRYSRSRFRCVFDDPDSGDFVFFFGSRFSLR